MAEDIIEPLEDDDPGPHRRIDPANIGPDGDYIVGRGRPPAATRFAVGDGRSRGRRPKGQKNFDTESAEEAGRKVTVRENGKVRKVTKLRSTIIRALDNAGSKGQNQAIRTGFDNANRISEAKSGGPPDLGKQEEVLLDDYLRRRFAQLAEGDRPEDDPPEESGRSDPEDDPEDSPAKNGES